MRVVGMAAGIAAVVLFAGLALAQGSRAGSDFGRREYERRCASCHGADGEGHGVNQPYLDHSPADLSRLAKANGGEFPFLHFHAVVDGRYERGASDMPCFADVYAAEAAADYADVPYETERYVDMRLAALASHVAALQDR